MIRAALDGYAERVKRDRANAYDAALLPLLKAESIPSRAEFIGEEERDDVAQTPEDMFAVLAAMPGAVVTLAEED